MVLAALPRCTTEHGIPVELPEIRQWREALPRDRRQSVRSNRKYSVDGSCLRPRLPEVRVAAWAVVGRDGEDWWSRAGPRPGAQTIGRAELAAVCHVLCSATPGVIVTDCLSIQKKRRRIKAGLISLEELLKGANANL